MMHLDKWITKFMLVSICMQCYKYLFNFCTCSLLWYLSPLFFITSGGPLDFWRDAECGRCHCRHSWIICPPGHRGCDMEGVLSWISCLGYTHMVCCTHCNGWISQQIWSHLLVQPNCSQGLSSILLVALCPFSQSCVDGLLTSKCLNCGFWLLGAMTETYIYIYIYHWHNFLKCLRLISETFISPFLFLWLMVNTLFDFESSKWYYKSFNIGFNEFTWFHLFIGAVLLLATDRLISIARCLEHFIFFIIVFWIVCSYTIWCFLKFYFCWENDA